MKKTQAERIKEVLADGEPHSTVEILQRVYGPSHSGIARIGARIHDLKGKGLSIDGWKDPENPTIYWYKMAAMPKKARMVPVTVMRDGVRYVKLVPEGSPEAA